MGLAGALPGVLGAPVCDPDRFKTLMSSGQWAELG